MDLAPLLSGDRRALARAATAIENQTPEAYELLAQLSAQSAMRSFEGAGAVRIVGVTGPPGAGKSTLVDGLTAALRAQGKRIAVLAVDPSSSATGGAILGDRIRMQRHHDDPGVFIRSMATRGAVGGMARATAQVAQLLLAAGFDCVLLETVGVGQDEIDIARLANVVVLVLVPGMGDDVQAIKAGIMEIPDIYVINKADRPGADATEREIRNMLSLGSGTHDGPPVLRTVALEGKGIGELIAAIESIPHRVPARGEVGTSTLEIDHLGIAVRSIDSALRFYESALGMNVSHRETVAHEKVHVAMMPLESSRIELLEPIGSDSPVGKFIEKRGEGIHHVALKVPDLPAAIARLKQSGARILNEPLQGAGGHFYVFVHPASTGGVLLELIQA